MTHKNSRGDELFYGDKDSKGCEIAPMRPLQKEFCKYVITDELGALRLAYEGLWLWAAD